MNAKLNGLRVLILEDETLVSMMLEDMLADLGCRVVGPFMRVPQALDHVAGRDEMDVDAAILDVNVAGERSTAVAEALNARGIPFVFATGYGSESLDGAWREHRRLGKPFSSSDLASTLEIMADERRAA